MLLSSTSTRAQKSIWKFFGENFENFRSKIAVAGYQKQVHVALKESFDGIKVYGNYSCFTDVSNVYYGLNSEKKRRYKIFFAYF